MMMPAHGGGALSGATKNEGGLPKHDHLGRSLTYWYTHCTYSARYLPTYTYPGYPTTGVPQTATTTTTTNQRHYLSYPYLSR